MNHYQKSICCRVCGEEIIIDIISFGVSHERIEAATHRKCGEKVGGKIMGDKVEQLKFHPSPSSERRGATIR